MSLQDPISDMFTQIRNGQMMKKENVVTPMGKNKVAILNVLQNEGYILGYEKVEEEKPALRIFLKYYQNKPVIEQLSRVSRPGLRIYRKKDDLPKVLGGLGIAIVSTPMGVMSDKEARQKGQGGEILCLVA